MARERYEQRGAAKSGRFGDVYKVWDSTLEVERAFKKVRVIDDNERARAAVVLEAQLLVKLEGHPNIVKLYDVIEGDTYVGLIMDWIEGETLTEYLRRQGTLGTAEALAITREVLQALEFAHRRRIRHSDIKPGNVMRTAEGSIRLVDFGVARTLGSHSMGTAVGVTLPYAPPEYFQPPHKLDLRADLWAVGVMLYQLVTGKQPFTVEPELLNHPFAWANAITPCQYVAPPDSTIAALLKRVLVPLDQRLPTAEAFHDALIPKPVPSPLREGGGAQRGTSEDRGEVKPSAPPKPPRYPLLEAYKAQLVLIPAGTLKRQTGTEAGYEVSTEPMLSVIATVPAFWMGRTPVTVGMWQEFCVATKREMPELPKSPVWKKGWDAVRDHPIVRVSWEDASTYADWANLALPSEVQWEYAANGGDGREYPWGDEWDATRCQCSKKYVGDSGGTSRVGSYPAGPFGLYDMAGNVWEWCADWYDETKKYRALRGGSWFSFFAFYLRCAYRGKGQPAARFNIDGFRLSSSEPR